MKKILVPTDFSRGSEIALNYAIEFAKKENAVLILLNSYSVNYPVAETPLYVVNEIEESAKAEVELKLKEFEIKIKHTGQIEYELIAQEGIPVKNILGSAREKAVDLIIMGTQGSNAVVNRMFGSTTAKVMEKADCPVIAVPEKAGFHPIKKITYATNYDKQDIRNLKKVIEFASLFEAQVNVLHIADEGLSSYYDKTTMHHFVDKVNKEIPYSNLTFQILNSVDLTASFYKYLQNNPSDLLILSTHHHSFWEKLLGKSVTHKLAYHVNIPLMVMHNATTDVNIESTPPLHKW